MGDSRNLSAELQKEDSFLPRQENSEERELRLHSERVEYYLLRKWYSMAKRHQAAHLNLCDERYRRSEGDDACRNACVASRTKLVSILIDMKEYQEALDVAADAIWLSDPFEKTESDDTALDQFAICCCFLGMTEESFLSQADKSLPISPASGESFEQDLLERFRFYRKAPGDMEYDVFISYKSEDEAMARDVYSYLKESGKSVFFAKETLPQLGSSEYEDRIFEAMDRAKHMIVVCSDPDYLTTPWVKEEWMTFNRDLRDGHRKQPGNLLLLLSDGIVRDKSRLPSQLRGKEILKMSEFRDRLLFYLR